MEVTSESAFQDIRKRIERENTPPSGRRVFSAATKSAIEDLLQEGHRPGFLSLKLGISESCLGKWKKRLSNNTSRPKRLQVVNHFPAQPTSEAQLADADQIEVHLPNGIVLKNVRLNVKILQFLRSC